MRKKKMISTRLHAKAMKKESYRKDVKKFHKLLLHSLWDVTLMIGFMALLLEDPWPPLTNLGCFIILVLLFRSAKRQTNILFTN